MRQVGAKYLQDSIFEQAFSETCFTMRKQRKRGQNSSDVRPDHEGVCRANHDNTAGLGNYLGGNHVRMNLCWARAFQT